MGNPPINISPAQSPSTLKPTFWLESAHNRLFANRANRLAVIAKGSITKVPSPSDTIKPPGGHKDAKWLVGKRRGYFRVITLAIGTMLSSTILQIWSSISPTVRKKTPDPSKVTLWTRVECAAGEPT